MLRRGRAYTASSHVIEKMILRLFALIETPFATLIGSFDIKDLLLVLPRKPIGLKR